MFRFSIRDMLWLTALVAFTAAWWVDHRRLADELRLLANDKWQHRAESLKTYIEERHGARVEFTEGLRGETGVDILGTNGKAQYSRQGHRRSYKGQIISTTRESEDVQKSSRTK